MVRTSGGIRISAGKSSKKGGGGRSTSNSSASGSHSTSTPSTPSGKSSSKGTSRLPPIPHCEAPSWQKPITNFFNLGAGSSKDVDKVSQNKMKDNGEQAGCSGETEEYKSINFENEKTENIENEKSNSEDETHYYSSSNEQPPEKKKKTEDRGKENVDGNITS